MKYLTLLLLFATFHFAHASFSTAPTASVNNGNVTISFSVDSSTDVEVAILNITGKIIRHLAAGMLGGQFPPPDPLLPGLSQSLIWDGKDDAGNGAAGGPFSVRVRAGLLPKYERSISTKTGLFPTGGGYYTYDGLDGWHLVPSGDMMTLDNPLIQKYLIGENGHKPPHLDIAVDKSTDEVYIKPISAGTGEAVVDGLTGKLIRNVTFPGLNLGYWGELAISRDGQTLYHSTGVDVIGRYNPQGQPTVWSSANSNQIGGFQQGFQHSRGHAVGPDGKLYVLHNSSHRAIDSVFVSVVGTDGKIAQSNLVVIGAPGSGGIRVDLKGNIYVGAWLKPNGQLVPAGINLTLPGVRDTSMHNLGYWALRMYGSLLKFGPQGGEVKFGDPSGEFTTGTHLESKAKGVGVLWSYFGVSPMPNHYESPYYTGTSCECHVSRFDVDGYGRLFLIDAFRYAVVILDNNRNEIGRVRYKDMPAYPTRTWVAPHQVEASDRAFYVADPFLDNVTVVGLHARDSVTLSLPVSVEQGRLSFSSPVILMNNPNPFRQATEIRYQLAGAGQLPVALEIYSADGRKVAALFTGRRAPGAYSAKWSAATAASGVYVARLRYGQVVEEKKLLLTK